MRKHDSVVVRGLEEAHHGSSQQPEVLGKAPESAETIHTAVKVVCTSRV